ncbi:MAG: beta-lactamase family protein [Planctomycetales bacterium]|nr:beta-lactamase family protein [Planctomycetales bacterium]
MSVRFIVLSSLVLGILANAFDLAAQDALRIESTAQNHPATRPETTLTAPTGCYDPRLASFDELIGKFLAEREIPGAALAVTRHGRLVYARGFGYANVESRTSVQPDSLFRIASISKPITAVAIMQLVEQGRLRLDDKVFSLLAIEPHVVPETQPDPRLREITIRHLLQHTAGWDRDKSYDPMFRSVKIAETLGVPAPAMPRHIIRYMAGQPLDFKPGERYAYSNLGYSLLGRVIEHVSGEAYDDYVRRCVLAPVGACQTRLGFSFGECRADGEVTYYESKANPGKSVFSHNLGDAVPWQYGGWCLEAMDSHGGWIASAVDLVRFASAFDNPDNSRLLRSETIRTMFQRPEGAAGTSPDGQLKSSFYGCGWFVRPASDGKTTVWHTGSLDGTSTLLVRRHDGLTWAVLFNTRNSGRKDPPSREIDVQLHQAANAVREWPDYDLFTRFE